MFYQQDSILSYEQILDNSVLQISRENEKTLHIALASRDADKSINEITSLLRVVINAKISARTDTIIFRRAFKHLYQRITGKKFFC